ncbi:MAG: S1 RNA-binding domain-containing protein [Myxococcota bacterium]
MRQGATVIATVTQVVEYGAFLRVDDWSGLLHRIDYGWSRFGDAGPRVGDTIEVLVEQVAEDSRRFSASRKALLPDPWVGAAERYPVGTAVRCRVHGPSTPGYCEATVEDELDGLVQDLPAEAPAGRLLDAIVDQVDPDRRRILVRAAPEFSFGWWSFTLAPHRPAEGTYDRFSWVPALDHPLHGDFRWLGGAENPTNDAFARFREVPALRDRIFSCTGCRWTADEPVPCPVFPGAHATRFLADPQGLLNWYLHLDAGGRTRVLVSPLVFRADTERWRALASTWECAPEFEAFVYRFWLENQIWRALHGEIPLDDPHRAYLAALDHGPA